MQEGEQALFATRQLARAHWKGEKMTDSNPGKSTSRLGGRDGAVGEHTAWRSQEAANSKSPLGLIATLTCLFLLLLGLVSSTRNQFLPWKILAGIGTSCPYYRSWGSPCSRAVAAPPSYRTQRLGKHPKYSQPHLLDTAICDRLQ